MGKIVKARLHYGGAWYAGEAMLETNELLFRGEKRLPVPLEKIESAKVTAGRLVVRFGGEKAEFELGQREAAKWLERIRNPKSVVEKLGVKPGQTVWLAALHERGFVDQLGAIGLRPKKGARAPATPCDVIFYEVGSRAELAKLPDLVRSLSPSGALWVIRPKGVQTVTESDVMSAGKAAGLVDVKVVRFSETKTAENFVVPVAKRRG